LIRVLLIPSSDYLGHPFPQRHNHLFERIHNGRDFEVHVLRFSIFGRPRLKSRCVIHEIPIELKTRSTPLYYLSNAASHATEILRIVKAESIDVVVAGNLLPPLLYHVARELAQLKVPLIFDLQDYYPTSAAGYISSTDSLSGRALTRLFDGITRLLVKSSDAVTVPGVALAMYARQAGARRVELIPNGVSEHFLVRHDGSAVRRRLGFGKDEVVVGYVGSVEFWLDMKPLIEAVSAARRELSVRLLIIGRHLQSKYAKKVEGWIESYGASDITTWLDFIPHEEVPAYIASMDVGTIPFDVANSTAFYAAPNKLWEYLSQGVTVAATPIPEVLAHRRYVTVVRSARDYVHAIRYARDRKAADARHAEVERTIRERVWSRSAEKMKSLISRIVIQKRTQAR